ncbi:methyltransferase domain-containing protein [Candidatus Uhrbacteria bacterium]|nr:methyltransferase domain-containing protein [Candidatus Uhrbacteria bacterium]
MGIIHDMKELLRGKSFGRIAMNRLLAVELAECHGRWLDIGGGLPSYVKYLPADCSRVNTDIEPGPGATALDADGVFPFKDDDFDGVLALNMLYIVRDPVATLREVKRVMKMGASVVMTLPFFFPENPEPHDFHRWTREGVEKLLVDAGFRDIEISPVGGPGTAFAMSLMPGRGALVIRLCAAPWIFLWDHLDRKDPKRTCCFWLARARKII